MPKKIVLALLSVFCISMYTYGIDGWIRINQLGYLPNAQKKAVLLSESPQNINRFTIHDALTNEELGVFNTVTSKGEFQSFKSTYILDFSTFKTEGAFYLKAGLIYSPTIYINKNIYLGSADFVLNFIRHQRNERKLSTNSQPELNEINTESQPIEPERKTISRYSKRPQKNIENEQPKLVNLSGGWRENQENVQFGSTTAAAVYQMLFAYQLNPASFADKHDADGNDTANGIPDILDEAKWGLDWLLKMVPGKEIVYHQVGDNGEVDKEKLLYDDKIDNSLGRTNYRTVYLATGKPQGMQKAKNHSNGLASIAGKYSSAFALGSQVLVKYYPVFADSLTSKAIETYKLGKKYPGICQAITIKSTISIDEDNWTDDMELAANELFRTTYDTNYLKDAAQFGRMEPVSPWMCSDTTNHYQWYPFINLGHYMLANLENPRYQTEFKENLLDGIRRMNLYADKNPFNIGIPLVMNSNNLVVALATQCRLYRSLTNDSTYIDMENGLIDWLFGRNPWGISFVAGLPKMGLTSSNLQSGALVNGPVQKSVYNKLSENSLSKNDGNERFQSDWAVYHNDKADFITNQPTLDGTASLSYLLSIKQLEGVPDKTEDENQYSSGAIIRTDTSKKQISLVLAGNEFTDGYKIIEKALKNLNIRASFFFTGDFYRNSKNEKIIKELLKEKHYLGGNSDKNLPYNIMQNGDSVFITKMHFIDDLKANYKAMEKFGITKNHAPFFLPPHEWHNDSISIWCKEIGIQTVNYTPGTLSNSDISVPEMRFNYYSSNEIYNRILQVEKKQGLNGNILVFHLGSDKKRQDKFYPRLYPLLIELSKAGYDFVDLYQTTDIIGTNSEPATKQKRKN